MSGRPRWAYDVPLHMNGVDLNVEISSVRSRLEIALATMPTTGGQSDQNRERWSAVRGWLHL